MDEFGTLRLDITLPSRKVASCAMLLVEEYKPIVEEALREAREELLNDESCKNAIKQAIKRQICERIQKALTDTAAFAAERAIREINMYDTAKETLKTYC